MIRGLAPGKSGGLPALWAWCTSAEYRRARRTGAWLPNFRQSAGFRVVRRIERSRGPKGQMGGIEQPQVLAPSSSRATRTLAKSWSLL